LSAAQVDQYLSQVEEPKKTTLELLRESILRVVPDAEQCISYGMPAFKVKGKVVAGFAAFKNHLSYLPHSGSVLDQLADDLDGRSMTKGSLHFAIDQPLPDELVQKLVSVRLRQAFGAGEQPTTDRSRPAR
jgi:uncharacterized protein YdhG (YjbR/CyaY superfamily)